MAAGTPAAPVLPAGPWRLAGLALGAALMIALAGTMGWYAAASSPLDAILLGIGAVVMAGFALSLQWWWSQPRLRPSVPFLGLFASRWLIYPLGTVLLARFILLPAELDVALIGVAAGIVFLLPVILFLLHALLQVGV